MYSVFKKTAWLLAFGSTMRFLFRADDGNRTRLLISFLLASTPTHATKRATCGSLDGFEGHIPALGKLRHICHIG